MRGSAKEHQRGAGFAIFAVDNIRKLVAAGGQRRVERCCTLPACPQNKFPVIAEALVA